MAQLDSMTQQNAALAEQSAAAAQSPGQHADKLAAAIPIFKMRAGEDELAGAT